VPLQPKVIKFDRGMALDAQETRSSETPLETLDWQSWFDTAEMDEALTDEAGRMHVASALCRLWHTLSILAGAGPAAASQGTLAEAGSRTTKHPQVEMVRGGDSTKLRVIAAVAADEGALKLAPRVRNAASIVAKTSSPWALEATMQFPTGQGMSVFIIGQASVPAPVPTSASVPPPVLWKPTHFPWPFWAVKRTDVSAQANCVLQPWTVRCVGTFAQNTPADGDDLKLDAMCVTIPIMVNSKPLERGDELVVYWPSSSSADSSKPKKAPSTWVDEARNSQRKRKL